MKHKELLDALHDAHMALQGLTLELTGGYNHEPRTKALRPLVDDAMAVEWVLREKLHKLNYPGYEWEDAA